MRLLVALTAAALLASAAHAVPGERDRLNACKAMLEHAGPAPAAGAAPEAADVQKCRQMIKEWTLRDSRMSVDENGKPMK
jgi:hypothetical protein